MKVDLETRLLEKDLGVIVDPELKFSQHIERQVNKANKILDMICLCGAVVACGILNWVVPFRFPSTALTAS